MQHKLHALRGVINHFHFKIPCFQRSFLISILFYIMPVVSPHTAFSSAQKILEDPIYKIGSSDRSHCELQHPESYDN